MFVIRTAQLEALGKALERAFMRRAADHLRKRYPDSCKALGDEGVQTWVAKAMEKRSEHRFEDEESILVYLDLMQVLGFDFDADPRLPWVKGTLDDPDLSAKVRLALLWERAHAQQA
jgi:hypothetical protein